VPGAIRNSVRAQLVVLFFAITAAAVAFIYLYVVPQLSSSLTAERLQRLESSGAEAQPRFEEAATRPQDPAALARLAQRASALADARVTLLGIRNGEPEFVLADSQSEAEASLDEYPPSIGAIETGLISSGVTGSGDSEIAQTAVPVEKAGKTVWVAVYSTSLEEVTSNVALIRRQIIIAGGIALVASLLAAYLAAGAHARRLGRLEIAAEEVAQGNFSVPIPIESDDEVGQLAKTLDAMQKRLARLDSARREFIANASHELRTPIASLGGFLELLEDDDPDAESREEFLRTMRGQVQRLEKLTADLLDLSRIDADALALTSERLDLIEIAGEVAEEFAAVAARDGTEIVIGAAVGGKPLARADHTRTMQIMRILIDNAMKHTPPGTTITITTETSPETTAISVADDGPGIAPGDRERIFDRFHSADPGGGSGLGLAISRELARLMGGNLIVQPGTGPTTFTLNLPTADVPV
jgi:signal transduction histidine kinase